MKSTTSNIFVTGASKGNSIHLNFAQPLAPSIEAAS